MKEWRDWFYFSSGERRALIFLTVLIIATWIALWVTNKEAEQEMETLITEVNAPKDTIRQSIPLHSQSIPKEIKPEPKAPAKPKEARAFHKPFQSGKKKYVSHKYPKGTLVELPQAFPIREKEICFS